MLTRRDASEEPRRTRMLTLGYLAAALVAVAACWAGLHGSFLFDDELNILKVEALRLDSLTAESIRQVLSSGISGPSGRPVAQLSFALNYHFSGFDPFAFKAVNLAIHIANGLLVLLLAMRLLPATSARAEERRVHLGAVLLAAMWLLHPIQLTPVLHVVQRMTSLSALFLFAALILHVQGREAGGRGGMLRLVLAWGLLWPLSYLCKESGALFPLFVLAWELILRRRAFGMLDRFARVFAVLAGLTFAAGALYAVVPAGQWLWAGYEFRTFTPVERLLTEGRVLWFYLGLVLLPRLEAFGLYHDDFAISTDLFDPWTTLPAWAGLAGLAWLAWRLRDRAPLVSFGIAWFFAGHALESTLLPLEIAHEHRNYVPLFGVALACWGAPAALPSLRNRYRALGLTLACVVLVLWTFVTALRAHQYGEPVRQSQIEAQHHPLSPRAHHEAGRVLAALAILNPEGSPAHSMARRHFEMAGALDPAFKPAWLALMQLNCQTAQPVDSAWIAELARRLRETPFAPADHAAMHHLKESAIDGTLCLERSDIERLFAAAGSNPGISAGVRVLLHSWLADYLALGARDLAAATVELDRSLAIAPYNPSNRLKRAQLAFLLGRHAESREMLSGLKTAHLSQGERETLSLLQACIAGSTPEKKCEMR